MHTETKKRDLRVDLFRGLALATIFIDHVPGNLYENFTYRNVAFSDATEIFVFLAGFAAALAYYGSLQRSGALFVWAKAWRRAFQLYAAHILAVLLGIGVLAWAAIEFGDPSYLEWIGLAGLFEKTPETLLGIPVLGFQPGYFNILPLYIVLLLWLPVLVLLQRRFGPGAMLGLAFALWLSAQLSGFNLPHWPGEHGWFLNPLAWQLLFAIGLACGWAVREGRVLLGFHPWLYALAGAYVVAAAAMKLTDYYPSAGDLPLPFFLYGQEKSFMTLPRLLHVLAVAYLVAYLPQRLFARLDPKGAFVAMGRCALPVFVAGSVLAIVAQVVRHAHPLAGWQAVAFDGALIGLGLGFQILLAKGLLWFDETAARRRDRVTAAPAAVPAAASAQA